MQQHLMLNSNYPASEKTGINKDIPFDFTGIHILVYIDDAIAQPIGLEQSQMLQDNELLNPK